MLPWRLAMSTKQMAYAARMRREERQSRGLLERRKEMRRILSWVTAVVAFVMSSGFALAAEAAGAPDSSAKAMIALAAGFAIGIGALGAALGQGRMAAAAMESIGRNPNAADKIQLPMILGLAFIEALALYAFVIAFFLQGKL
jgi:F-type H+-transporting ATPase subunit c